LLEVIGGIALLVGVVTRITSILFIIEMIGTTIVAELSEGFVGGFELELLLVSVGISLLLTGPGKISVEYNILKREIFPKGKMIVNEIRQREPR
jgi:putative oxidoreductase